MNKNQIPVAREGYPYIAFAGLATLVASILGYDIVALSGLALTGFIFSFFRDPERISPDDEDALVSPADGKVILVDKVFDEKFTREHVYKISIFMNVFNVHVNRCPFPAKVSRVLYSPGSFYAADSDQGALANENCALILTTQKNRRMAVVQVAGLIARRIVCWVRKNDELERGQRFGIICFGSRVDLYLPLQVQLEVKPGQKVKAGETILGYLS